MRPSIPFLTAATLTAVLAGCATPGADGVPAGATGTIAGPVASATATATATATADNAADLGSAEPTSQALSYRVTYDWAVPSTQATVDNPLNIPLAGPVPLPYLAGIYVGDHPDGNPAYERISFYFRGGFPSYNLQYVPGVVSEGLGKPVDVPGNAVLRIGFIQAQAHDGSGSSTIATQPPTSIDFDTVRGYGFAGDFEGYLTYALGIQVAPGSDQALPIRAGELTKSDGAGGTFYVVHVDVRKA